MKLIYTIFACFTSLLAFSETHTLQIGESFEDVARLYDIPLDSLLKYNPDTEPFVGYAIEMPLDNLFYDLGESDIFRKLRYKRMMDTDKGNKIYKSAYKNQLKLVKVSGNKRKRLEEKIFDEYSHALENGNIDAVYQLGMRYLHGSFSNPDRKSGFDLEINPDFKEFTKGIEYLQIANILGKNNDALIALAVACGHESSPIRNPYLCVSMLENFADNMNLPVNNLICYMYENGYGINRNLQQAYIYCSETELIGTEGSPSKREKLMTEIEQLPQSAEASLYGNGLESDMMLSLGLSYYNNDVIASQGLYWLHRAARMKNADANWALASILKNGNFKNGSVGASYNIEDQAMTFVERAASCGKKEAKEYLAAYREQQRKKAEYERELAEQKRREDAIKKERRKQMWLDIAGTVITAAAQTWGQIEYAKQMNAYAQHNTQQMPTIGGMSEAQWRAKNQLAMEQILQYSINKHISDWYGTPMVPTDMSAVNFGTDMTPGSPLWSWNMQQQINRMSAQNTRMSCEISAYYKRQTDIIAQQLNDNPFQPIAGYVDIDGNWIPGETVGSLYSESGSDTDKSEPHHDIREKNRSYFSERYGNKDCHICHGRGKCQTCNGQGYVSDAYGTRECPNCLLENGHRTGKCGTCQGRGTVFGFKY